MFTSRPHGILHCILIILWLTAMAVPMRVAAQAAQAEDKQGVQQPAVPVVTAKARTGKVTLQNEFIGSIEFPEVSDVAAEVQGRVSAAFFEEGDILAADHIMVELDNALLSKDLEAAKAQHAQALADLESARLEFGRMNTLYSSKSVSEKEFDEARLTMKALQQKALSFKAEAERLKLEIAKSHIRAPFAGVVLKKHASRGEWVSPGTVIATLARNDVVEAVVEVPQVVLPFLSKGQNVSVSVLGNTHAGTISAIIPQGNLTTRTFPVKVRIGNISGLMQGMEAKVSLPAGTQVEATIVPRDAVISQRGQTTIWTVRDGKAEPVPVTIDAWLGNEVAVHGPGLSAGMPVVVKGNERLRPGQPVADSQ